MIELTVVADYGCTTGEGPTWHAAEQALYWTDIPNGKLYRYDVATKRHEQVYDGRVVGGITVQQDGKLLLFMDRGSIATFDKGTVKFLIEGLEGEEDNRFNDVIADPEGRVFAGTMTSPTASGSLYRVEPDLTIKKVVEGTGTSNGMGFSGDLRGFYFTDTRPATITVYEYERASGEIANPRIIVKTDRQREGAPDGMTVDSDDNLWSARWGGACVVKHSPDGVELERIDFPVLRVSCPTFGGRDYRDMFVTTAGGQDKTVYGELAGALFTLRPGVQGRPEFLSRIGL